MTDVNPIQGPRGPQDALSKKEKKEVNPEKFQEEMKVQKVREIDPEQSKKRKRREEQEDEETEVEPEPQQQTSSGTTPSPYEVQQASTKRPQVSLGEAPSDPIPYAKTTMFSISETDSGSLKGDDDSFTQSLPSAPPGYSEQQEPPPFSQPPQAQGQPPSEGQQAAPPPPSAPPESEPDMGGGFGGGFEESGYPSAPPSPENQTTSQGTQAQPSQQPQQPQTNQTTPSEPSKDKDESSKEKKPSIPIPTGMKKEMKGPLLKGTEAEKDKESFKALMGKPGEPPSTEKKPAEEALPSAPPKAPALETSSSTSSPEPSPHAKEETMEQKAGFFETFRKVEEKGEKQPLAPSHKKAEKEEEEEAALSGVGMPAPSVKETEAAQQEKKEKENKDDTLLPSGTSPAETQLPLTPAMEGPFAPPPKEPSYTRLHPIVMDQFERMVGVISVMQEQGKTETVIHLTAPQFASSIFFGSQIVIQEFSTAPKAYNIQLLGSPEAIKSFDENVEQLLNSFETGNYNFKINRLETGLTHVEKPLIRRKEGASEEEEQQQEGDNSE